MGQDKFASRLLRWYDRHGRHDLPWQFEPTPYRVWVSEIMLQQTQVSTVIPYYQRFMQRFVDLHSLAEAELDEVLQHWAGLGYYARGRNLHRAAREISERHQGEFPDSFEAVVALPGIGRSTAGAILALAHGQRHAILDGNVRRSLCRYHGVEGHPGLADVQNTLWRLAESHTPHSRVADYTQAVMDFGATLCTRSRPGCAHCPQQPGCAAFRQGRVSELPTPRPRRQRPLKQCHMLALIESGSNELLLFRRPATGLWGGLYSLPEFDSLGACQERLRACTTAATTQTLRETPIRHAFTHFDLDITPLACYLEPSVIDDFVSSYLNDARAGKQAADDRVYRMPLNAPKPGVGLPAPVQRIVKALT